jgi:gluconate kinase
MGYAQSKSVAERICANAAEQGVKVRVLRVGQLVGDTQHGVWNAQEAVPMMLQTALTVGSLPKLKETPSWLPVDTAAESITDISLSDAGSLFANVTHPKTFDFVKDLLPALEEAGLEFEQVEPKEWVRRLRASNPDPKLNPPIKLVDFFASKYDKDEFAPSKPFATDVAQSLSPCLANAPVLDQGFVKKFTEYFLQNAWTALPGSTTCPKFAVFVFGIDEVTSAAVGQKVSNWLSVPLVEGQPLHTRPAIEKLRQGVALSLGDTTGWLSRLSSRITEALLELSHPSVVLTSSTMSQPWRFQLRDSLARQNIKTLFIYLQVTFDSDTQISSIDERERPAVGEIDVLPVDFDGDETEVFESVKWMLQVKRLNPSE